MKASYLILKNSHFDPLCSLVNRWKDHGHWPLKRSGHIELALEDALIRIINSWPLATFHPSLNQRCCRVCSVLFHPNLTGPEGLLPAAQPSMFLYLVQRPFFHSMEIPTKPTRQQIAETFVWTLESRDPGLGGRQGGIDVAAGSVLGWNKYTWSRTSCEGGTTRTSIVVVVSVVSHSSNRRKRGNASGLKVFHIWNANPLFGGGFWTLALSVGTLLVLHRTASCPSAPILYRMLYICRMDVVLQEMMLLLLMMSVFHGWIRSQIPGGIKWFLHKWNQHQQYSRKGRRFPARNRRRYRFDSRLMSTKGKSLPTKQSVLFHKNTTPHMAYQKGKWPFWQG